MCCDVDCICSCCKWRIVNSILGSYATEVCIAYRKAYELLRLSDGPAETRNMLLRDIY